MSILNIPVTATNIVEWVRRCADAVNALIRASKALEVADTALDTRVDALETFVALPFAVDSVTFRPVPLPASPSPGMTVLDQADNVLKTYAAGTWHNLY